MNTSRLSVFLEHPSLLLFAQNLSLHGESLETRLVFPQVMPIILDPGDALIFHGELAHYTPPNVTTTRSAIFVYKPPLFAKKKNLSLLFDWLKCCRRRSLQFHYASSKCQRIKCPKKKEEEEETNLQEKTVPEQDSKPHYFDCDPSCVETKYYYYEKGELLVTGRDFGEGYI